MVDLSISDTQGAHAVQELCARLRAQGVASVSIIALLDKAARRTVDLAPDYRGFEVGAPPPVPPAEPLHACQDFALRPACTWRLLLLHKLCCIA